MQPCVSARDFAPRSDVRGRGHQRVNKRGQGLPGQNSEMCETKGKKSSSTGAKIVSSSPRTAEIEAITYMLPLLPLTPTAPRAALGSESSEPRPCFCVGSLRCLRRLFGLLDAPPREPDGGGDDDDD